MAARQYWVGDNGQIYSSTNAANIPTDRPTYGTHAGATAQASVSPTSTGNWPSTAAQAGYSYGVEMPQPTGMADQYSNPASATYGGFPPPADQVANWPGPGWFWNGSSWQKNLTNEESYQDWINGGAQGWANWQAGITPGSPNYTGGGAVDNYPGSSSTNPLGGQQGGGGYSAVPTSPSPGPDYMWDGFQWVINPAIVQARKNAAELLNKTFEQYGITGLASMIEQWLKDGYSSDTISLLIRDTTQYKERFPAMERLAQQGMAITESQYIDLERSYKQIMNAAGLPTGFYDQPDDFAGFIGNQVAPDEVADRVYAAKRYLEASPQEYRNALQQYYGVTAGQMLAYVLDANRAQDVIRRQLRATDIGGAAAQDGFKLDLGRAEALSNTTIGQTLDPFNPQSRVALEDTFGKAREWADADRKLSRIEGINYNDLDAVDVAFGDKQKELQSRKRASREVGRFSGSSAIGRTSLAERRAQ